ncbi:MAG TPA: hypothetical protein VLA68_05950 [Nitrososphaera sp.]|nr:hypothetical protein [Nitrososphaera sp.]
MTPAGVAATVEEIDRLYFCAECKMVFLFKSDSIDHERISGHAKMHEMPFVD